eukprot:473407-Amphidinium_carterae.1
MWITCGKIPASYLTEPTDPRHRFYNFHKEVHFAITDYINLYLYNMPYDFSKTARDDDIAHKVQRQDFTRWYSRKEQDHQYQIKAGETQERLGGPKSTVTVGHYMELKVAYKQKHRTVIENKSEYKQNHYHDYSIITTPKNLNEDYAVKMTVEIYLQAATKRERERDQLLLLHPPHENRFFLFLVQHYERRLFNIFQRAGATVDEYNR